MVPRGWAPSRGGEYTGRSAHCFFGLFPLFLELCTLRFVRFQSVLKSSSTPVGPIAGN